METAFGRGVEEEVEESVVVFKKAVNNSAYNSASSILVAAKSNRDGGLDTRSKDIKELESKMERLARENEELRNGGNHNRGGFSGGYNGGRGGFNNGYQGNNQGGLGGNRGGYGGNNYQGGGRGGYSNGGNGYNGGFNSPSRGGYQGGYNNNGSYNNNNNGGYNNLQRYPNKNGNEGQGRNEYNRSEGDFCPYCGGEGHTSRNCAACKIDMDNKLVTTDGQDLYLPNGKKLDMTKERYGKSEVADYSLRMSQKPVVKEEKSEGQTVKTNVGKLGGWTIPSISSAKRVSYEADVAKKKGSGVPTRVSPRFGKQVEPVVEAPDEPEEEEELRERFSTPGWDGEDVRVQSPVTSTPRSILKRKDKEVIELDRDEEKSRVQKEREEILKEVVIKNEKGPGMSRFVSL
ncbi:hypothetical protein CROQUDRAFT_99877 [Cronartium quercuum f. sp. fusiforme G11]|uniref:CCHC-type domain-containing protein n=1 Tax=Cronartium quercuum f. sp. fusiforme G11 TaxID=708437 RepID=A0A9P6T6A0_9BASI|nr:hypothetical protein CROQUDRAFT_99877 [Cronartium quercuum f. sp. fusiforme G11]